MYVICIYEIDEITIKEETKSKEKIHNQVYSSLKFSLPCFQQWCCPEDVRLFRDSGSNATIDTLILGEKHVQS